MNFAILAATNLVYGLRKAGTLKPQIQQRQIRLQIDFTNIGRRPWWSKTIQEVIQKVDPTIWLKYILVERRILLTRGDLLVGWHLACQCDIATMFLVCTCV